VVSRSKKTIGRLAPAVCAFLLAVGAASAASPEELFERGNAAYADGRYAEAVDAYREVLRYRIRDARVEYNLGNALFRTGRLGEAILHFERAHRMAPTDPDIEANLEFARSARFDRVELPEVHPVVRWTRELQDRIGPAGHAWALVALAWITAFFLFLRLARPGSWNAAAGWSLAGLVLVAALVAASWWATYQRLDGRRLAVILRPAVEVLAGPGENNPTLFTVHEGLTLEVRSERERWIQVSLPNGLNGWIPVDAAGIV
jgi:tetratricopeptide (TPR) repeat protein